VVTFSETASFSDKRAGTGKTVTVGGIALGEADAGNYSLTATTATTTADITPKDLTATYTGANKVYDATTSATVRVPPVTSSPRRGDLLPGGHILRQERRTGKTVNVERHRAG